MMEFLLEVVMDMDNNAITKYCMAKYPYENAQKVDWNKVSGCASELRAIKNDLNRKELQSFLEHNPRYRFPGQSLNKCFGKPRELPFKEATFSAGPYGLYAEVKYKDKLPADCFQSKPWDNRDTEN